MSLADATDAAIAVTGGSGTAVPLTEADLARLPATKLTVSFGKGPVAFEGPLLWTVLARSGAVDPTKPRGQSRQIVMVTGSDGYVAVLALGEISPAFDGKQVILADRMDGRPLDPGHFRVVVPGEQRGARSVRDVVGIAVTTPEPPGQ
ncbi:MAG: molybdopterin-dependent oxidoreductase [Acetobacteraceae bacterium]